MDGRGSPAKRCAATIPGGFPILFGSRLAGATLFAQLHETLIPIFYDPTKVGQQTLTDLFGNQAMAVTMLVVVINTLFKK